MCHFCRSGMGPCSKGYQTLAILLALVAFLLGTGVVFVSRSGDLPFRRATVEGRGGQEIAGWKGGLYYGQYYGAIAAFYAKPVCKKKVKRDWNVVRKSILSIVAIFFFIIFVEFKHERIVNFCSVMILLFCVIVIEITLAYRRWLGYPNLIKVTLLSLD